MKLPKGMKIGGGQDARATVVRASCPMPCVLALILMVAPAANAFGDNTVGDKEIAFRYLDQVREDVGFEVFDAISDSLATRLALTLGRLDRECLTSKAFIQHLREVENGKVRFYQQRKLTSDEVETYLLPYRIRHELTSKAEWMTTLAKHFQPVTATATTADDAAQAVCGWMVSHLKLLDPALSYPLPQRGDLDPLTVLKGGYGNEVDCAIFGVAALRASGVAARFVWAPALRGEVGGKAWLEYLNEAGAWVPWVPSFGAAMGHAEEIRKQIGAKILFVLARPEAPLEITSSYSKTLDITVHSTEEGLVVQLLATGSKELMPARGQEITRNERHVTIGRGNVVIAASFGMRSFAMLPVECGPELEQIHIMAESGGLAVVPDTEIAEKSKQSPSISN